MIRGEKDRKLNICSDVTVIYHFLFQTFHLNT